MASTPKPTTAPKVSTATPPGAGNSGTTAATASGAKNDRVPPKLGTIRTDVAIPEGTAARGSKSSYAFTDLPVGGSFAVFNKTVKSLSSIISNQNRKPGPRKLDTNGLPIVKTDTNGQPIMARDKKTGAPTQTPEYVLEAAPKYQAFETKNDPENAPVRVFRIS